MSINLNNERKLQLKSELLRHMETAKSLAQSGGSSQVKMAFLRMDLDNLEKHDQVPDIGFWDKWLQEAG